MSEPQIKLQVSLDNTNIESNVPGEQKLREDSKVHQSDDTKALPENPGEGTANTTDEKAANLSADKENAPGEAKSEAIDKELATQDDFVLTPVMTVTKEEAVFTKGDLKLQKISVTEDISGTTTVTSVTHEKVTLSNNDNPEINKEVLSIQQTKTESHGEDKNPSERKKIKTRIPTLRFRQAVEKLKKERRNFEEKKEPETPQSTTRRSSIPRLKNSKIPPPNIKVSQSHKVEKSETSPQIDDEFDKLYDDLVDDQDSDDNLSIASKIEDPVKLEDTFEEIIHAYEENKVRPINVEKVRNSKIPLLKRKSEQEIEIPKQTVTLVKQSVSLDSSTLKESKSVTENHSKIQSVSLNKSLIKMTTDSQMISETKSVHESSFEATERLTTISTKKNEENQNNTITKDIKQEAIREVLKNTKTVNETNNSLAEIQSVSQNTQSVSQNVSDMSNNSVVYKESVETNTEFGSFRIVNTATAEENTKLNTSTPVIQEVLNQNISHDHNEIKETVKIATPIFKTLSQEEIKSIIEKEVKTRNELRHETKSLNNVENNNSKSNIVINILENEISTESTSSTKNEIVLDETIKQVTTKKSLEQETKDFTDDTIKEVTTKKSWEQETKDFTGETIKQVSDMKSLEQQETKDFKSETIKQESNMKSSKQQETKDFNMQEKMDRDSVNGKQGEDNILREKVKKLLSKIKSRKSNPNVSNEEKSQVEQCDIHTNKGDTNISSVSKKLTKTVESVEIGSTKQEYILEPLQEIAKKDSSNNDQDNKENSFNKEDFKEEDIPIIRGKVSRILRRIDSIETNTQASKKDLGNDIPKYKSVMSKIAMFERTESSENLPRARVRCIAQIPKHKNEEANEMNNGSYNNGPKIVKEVLKATPSKVIEEKSIAKQNSKDTETSKIHLHGYKNDVPIVPVIKSPPPPKQHLRDNGYTFDIQIVNTQIKNDKWTNPEIVSEEVLRKPNMYQRVYSVDKRLSNDNTPPPSPQEINFSPTSISSSLNNKENISNTIGSSENIEKKKYETQTLNHGWKINHKVTDTVQDSKSFNSSYKVNETKTEDFSTHNRVESTSDLVKQEVNYEQAKIYDKAEETIENDVFYRKLRRDDGQLRIHAYRNESQKKQMSKSLAELDLGDAVKGKVRAMIGRMNSVDIFDSGKKGFTEKSRKISVSEKIALFERKVTPVNLEKIETLKTGPKDMGIDISEEECAQKIEDLSNAKKYGVLDQSRMQYLELRDGNKMPVIGIGTATLHPKITSHVIQAAIDLGYRSIDTAYIYGNEREVGDAINKKIKDGTVKREDLFIISKLWSTFHRQDLVEKACRASLEAMGLDYFDLYLIHNPMSFKEGKNPIPKIASVIQFSEHNYLEAWYGIEDLVRKGLVKSGGVSNFNSVQLDRLVEKGKIKPVINQVECHPYLSQHRLDDFCQVRNVKLCCYGVLGSKGTPENLKSAVPPVIDDPLVRVMAAGLGVTPAALLISYQVSLGRSVVVKASSAEHLWDNLQAVALTPSPADVSALHALNRNKRIFTFRGMGDTHKNYPFNIPF